MDVGFRIDEFSPAAFDLHKAAAEFTHDSDEAKRSLLQLVAAVHAADDEHDFAEDDYLRALGAALGLGEEHYRDLVIDVLEETDLADGLDDIRFSEG